MPIPLFIAAASAVASAVGAAGAAAAGAAAAGAAAASTVAAGVAAAGTAAGAVAASTAAAGATAAGAAAAGTVAAATTAAASTAAGSAVVGALGAVGTAVGGAAGVAAAATTAVPVISTAIGSVATVAGTAAGATAVGTIATAGAIGTVSGVSGAKKLSEASETKQNAMSRYKKEKTSFDSTEKAANSAMEKFGEAKVLAWSDVDAFVALWSRIKNKPIKSGDVVEEQLYLTKDQLDEFSYMALSVKDMIKNGVVSVSGGTLVGFAAQAGTATLATTASTGTAIASLSGAAATNATLAALGGGSLASGGLGMAGGTAVLGGIAAAPVLAIGGIMLNHQGSKAIAAAEDIEAEVDIAVAQFKECTPKLHELQTITLDLCNELTVLYTYYRELLGKVTTIVDQNDDYDTYTQDTKKSLNHLVLIVKLLKKVCLECLLDGQKVRTTEVRATILKSREDREQLSLS